MTFLSWPRHMHRLFFSARDRFFQRLLCRVDGIALAAPHIWPFSHKPCHSNSALPGATAVYQSLAQGHSCLLSPKRGQHFIFICHLRLLPPGAPLSLTRQETITSTLYIHLPSIRRVELIAGFIRPSFGWIRTKSSYQSLPGVVHLDLS